MMIFKKYNNYYNKRKNTILIFTSNTNSKMNKKTNNKNEKVTRETKNLCRIFSIL